MAVKSAKNGSVAFGATPTAVADATQITIREVVEGQVYASSSTSGEKRVVAGLSHITGSFRILVDSIPAGIAPGTTVRIVLKSDGSTTMYDDTSYIEDVDYDVPIGTGAPVEATITFHRNG